MKSYLFFAQVNKKLFSLERDFDDSWPATLHHVISQITATKLIFYLIQNQTQKNTNVKTKMEKYCGNSMPWHNTAHCTFYCTTTSIRIQLTMTLSQTTTATCYNDINQTIQWTGTTTATCYNDINQTIQWTGTTTHWTASSTDTQWQLAKNEWGEDQQRVKGP